MALAVGAATLAATAYAAPVEHMARADAAVDVSAPAPAATPRSPIQHVVIIYQENHTFDDLLGSVCARRPVPCDGYTGPMTLANGVTVPNSIEPDVVPNVGHAPNSQQSALKNQWQRISGCQPSTNYACITHAARSSIPNLAALADAFAVSDATYAAGDAASFTAHVEITTGSDAGFFGANPVPSKTGAPVKPGWGCPSNLDELWGVGVQSPLTYEPSCIPHPDGSGAYRATRVQYRQSIMEQLETAGLSWQIYVGLPNRPSSGYIWNMCSYVAWCQQRSASAVSPWAKFSTDAANGTLPNVSLISATTKWSQHNGASLSTGDNYIGSLVQAAMNGPQWDSTAIFITYDDCGCFYDHVQPPSGLGLRNPMVIVSPWAKPTYTDSTTAVQPYSMLTFIDHTFGLPPLSPAVASAYDYADSFDFSGAGLVGPIPMVHTKVPAATKAQVAKNMESIEEDPT